METTDQIAKLLDLKKSAQTEIYQLENEIKKLKVKIDLIEEKLMSICSHKWQYDYSHGIYEKPDKICELCDLRIIRF